MHGNVEHAARNQSFNGKHTAMDCPENLGTQDYNYKGFYSLVLLAACDEKRVFSTVRCWAIRQ